MKRTIHACIPALVALACVCGAAWAQTAPAAGSAVAGQAARPAKLARADRNFIGKAVQGGMFEVQVSRLAASKAGDPQVQNFAGMLVDQHTTANDELVRIANARGVALPATPGHGKQKYIDKLGRRNGADFDEHFVREVGIQDQEKNIKLFQKAGKEVRDAELKAFIDKTLPSLQEHLALARKLPQAGRKGD